MDNLSGSFEYKDQKLGDQQGIRVATRAEVFQPTSTTKLLLSAVRQFSSVNTATALDLGCGCGIVAVALAKLVFPKSKVFASDISEAAAKLTRQNAGDAGLDIDCRCGSMFEPWKGMKFDLIVDDVAGIAEPIARRSSWYPPQIHSDAGEDGTRWIVDILSQAPDYLTPSGEIFFPALTLSRESLILDTAGRRFTNVELVMEQWYPLGEDLLSQMSLLEDLMTKGAIQLKKKGSRWLWATKIYRASGLA